jgi:glycosyltransferase involved in cell wall biosynthesis
LSELELADRVSFLGFIEDVAAFYHAVDCVVVPSLEEPLGRVPLEAAAYERPAIAFATGGLPETIQDDVTGWLVPTGNVLALREALSRFIDGGAFARYGEAARTAVEDRCHPVRYANHIAHLYSALL